MRSASPAPSQRPPARSVCGTLGHCPRSELPLHPPAAMSPRRVPQLGARAGCRPQPSRRRTDHPPPPGPGRATARRDRGAPGGQASSHAILQPGERRKARGKRGGMPAGRTEDEQEQLQKAERVPARDRAVWKKRETERERASTKRASAPGSPRLAYPGAPSGAAAGEPLPGPLPAPLTALRRARRRQLPAALQPQRGRGMLGRALFIAAGSAAPRLWGAAPRSPVRCTWPRPRTESGRAAGRPEPGARGRGKGCGAAGPAGSPGWGPSASRSCPVASRGALPP